MSFRFVLMLFVAVFLSAGPVVAMEKPAADASDLFTKGAALLRQGDFDGAFQAYAAAAKADPENRAYADMAKRVRRVQLLRKYAATQKVSPKWEQTVRSLHAFYLQNGIHGEALAMDRAAHRKLNSALSASLLAETLLEMNRNGEALSVVEGLAPEKADLQTRLYRGIALARLGRVDEARRVGENLGFPGDAGFGLQYDFARLQALLGNEAGACTHLVRCFETTPPGRLNMLKGIAKSCADFRPFLASAGFQEAMKTASKVAESGCSMGSDCGSCSKRSGCSMDQKAGSSECGDGGDCDKAGGKDK